MFFKFLIPVKSVSYSTTIVLNRCFKALYCLLLINNTSLQGAIAGIPNSCASITSLSDLVINNKSPVLGSCLEPCI